MHESIETYIYTDNLDAIIYKDGGMKLCIYNKHHSPYGWDKRNLICAHYGVKDEEFTWEYIKEKVDEVYSTFPNRQIDELITKIKNYKNG